MSITNNVELLPKSNRLRQQHVVAKKIRHNRLANQVYGTIHTPIIPKNIIGIWDPPGYLASHRTCKYTAQKLTDGIDRHLDTRCFYSGVVCDYSKSLPGNDVQAGPTSVPWMGTRDHLVPARRDIPDNPVDVNKFRHSLVWTAYMVNVTLGVVPMLVRLKIRNWLMTIPYDRNDKSIAAGLNIKWIIIDLLDTFRINGRYPWSRDPNGKWWDPNISIPFMKRAWEAELKFLAMNDDDRDQWIRKFNWHF